MMGENAQPEDRNGSPLGWALFRPLRVRPDAGIFCFALDQLGLPPEDGDGYHVIRRPGNDRAWVFRSTEKEGPLVKILQVVPKAGIKSNLKTMLKNTERHLRGPHTTFQREREGRWKHVKYPGWIQWGQSPGGLLVAEIQTNGEGP